MVVVAGVVMGVVEMKVVILGLATGTVVVVVVRVSVSTNSVVVVVVRVSVLTNSVVVVVAIIVSVAMKAGKSSGSTLGLAGWLGSGLGRKLKEPCRVPHVWPLSSVM